MLHWSILWTQIIDKCYELGNQLADEMRRDNIYDLSKTDMFQSLTSSRLLNVDRDRLRAISKKYRQAPIVQEAKTNLYEYKQDSDYLADVLGLDTSNTTYLIQNIIFI